MVTGTMANESATPRSESASFESFAGISAVAVGALGLLYSIAFVVLKQRALYSLFELVGGVLTTVVLVALFRRLRETDEAFALWGVLLGFAGAIGSAIHGSYDLALAANPPKADVLGDAGVPFLVDPRGFMTFGVAGVGVFVIAWLMTRNSFFPRSLAYLGYVLAVLLVVLYLARLIVLDAGSVAVLLPAALAGFIVNPVWYVWLGLVFWRTRRA